MSKVTIASQRSVVDVKKPAAGDGLVQRVFYDAVYFLFNQGTFAVLTFPGGRQVTRQILFTPPNYRPAIRSGALLLHYHEKAQATQ
jgi:hypothetical protein